MSKTERIFSFVIIVISLVAFVIFMFGCENQKMAQEKENKTIARRYIEELWNKKNLDEVDNLVSDDFVNHAPLPGMQPGREGLKHFISFSGTTFPDGHYTIEDMIAEENKVMMRGSFRGTHRGEFMGIPGTGKEITMTWIIVLGLENGKVTERWAEYNALGMNQQIGFKLVPPE